MTEAGFDIALKGSKAAITWLKRERDHARKSQATAIKVEGYRARKLLIKEIRAGSPGGRPFAPLAEVSKAYKGNYLQGRRGYSRRRKALRRSADVVRYHITDKDPFTMAIGWTGPRVSKSWKRIMQKQQKGFTANIDEATVRYWASLGGKLSRRSPRRKYYFLKKTTRKSRTPARPIIDPFFKQYQDDMLRNIRENFRRKMRGERI
jgi:hypothetical protein